MKKYIAAEAATIAATKAIFHHIARHSGPQMTDLCSHGLMIGPLFRVGFALETNSLQFFSWVF
jgi:hypothetical protein